jgi:hypothetical protein
MVSKSFPGFDDLFSRVGLLPNLEPRYCSGMLRSPVRDDLLTPTPKSQTFAGDQIPFPGHDKESGQAPHGNLDGRQ